VNFIVGFGPGGGYDQAARGAARSGRHRVRFLHLPDHR
jgi:tripartite-type tricarboxylate transporter receptor subunit TctC